MSLRSCFLLTAFVAAATPCLAQSAAPRAAEPPIRRWFELQNFAVYTRYRFIESRDPQQVYKVTSNQQQYKEAIRARVNFDPKRRYTLNVGLFSGKSFTSSWDDLGGSVGGKRVEFDRKNHWIKQLYGAAVPVAGLELQYGGLYFVRGESTEYTTFDDDGYLVGERVSLRRPKDAYFDEISVTRGALESTSTPSVWKRGNGLKWDQQNYTQALVAKRFSSMVSGSFDYSRQAGEDIVHGALALRFKASAPITALRYEQYYRAESDALKGAGGFVLTVDRPLTKWARLQGGYATIDQNFGRLNGKAVSLNGDRFLEGRRVFVVATFQITPALTGTLFTTKALRAEYTVPIARRFDAILQYDLLSLLRRTGKI